MSENIFISESLKNRLDIQDVLRKEETKEKKSTRVLLVRSINVLENSIEIEFVVDDVWILKPKYILKDIMLREKKISFENELEFKFKSFYNIVMKEYKLPVCKIVIDEEKFWKELSHV